MTHRYSVEFRLYGKQLDPHRITGELGLQPSRTRVAGERLGHKVFDEGMWGFNGGDDYDWTSLEQGLRFVLDRLAGKEVVLAKLRVDHRAVWWCGHFQETFDGGPQLSPHMLARLGSFGADLFIDNYFQ